MKAKGFSLIELLVAIAILAILASIAVVAYNQYTVHSARIQLLSDLRNCIGAIAGARQSGSEESLSSIVANCPRSPQTRSITIENENPIRLRATADTVIGEVECEYTENTGRVDCRTR